MQRIAVALSGGVDSAVAALLLRRQGHELVGVTLRLRPPPPAGLPDPLEDARRVAAFLDIPFASFDLTDRFAAEVVEPFCQSYLGGRTPSPCPDCNRRLKFGALLDLARRHHGADRLATGHYVRCRTSPVTGRLQLLRGLDPAKDQSYMLALLTPAQLAQGVFPLGELTKPAVRELARTAGLPGASRPDSQDACFVDGDLHGFLDRRLGARIAPGPLVDRAGRVVGEHRGVAHYTVGQRRGLGRGRLAPVYVVALRPETNELVVGEKSETFAAGLWCRWFSWLSRPPTAALAGEVQIRYGAPPAPARLLVDTEAGCRIAFASPLPAVAPGQLAAFYQGEVLVGGGYIDGPWPGEP